MFPVEDLLVLDTVRKRGRPPDRLKDRVPPLVGAGVLEPYGKGRGRRYVLSRRLYGHLGKRGEYTRKRGLDRAHSRVLLLQHVRDCALEGAPMSELMQVLPSLKRNQIHGLLKQLRREGLVEVRGIKRRAKWFPTDG